MKSIKIKFEAVLITCMVALFALISILYARSLYNSNYAEAEKNIWTECRDRRTLFNDQLKRMEVAVDLVASHTKFYIHDETVPEAERMRRLETSAVETAQYTQNIYSVFYHANQNRLDTRYDFFYIFDDKEGIPREEEPRDPVTYESKTGIPAVWYDEVIESGESRWVGPYNKTSLTEEGSEVIAYIVPLYNQEGELNGVLGMEFSMKLIFDELNRSKLYKNGYIFLTDSEGKVLWHPVYENGTELNEVRSKIWDSVKKVYDDESADKLISYTLEGQKRVMAPLRLENNMVLIASVARSDINAPFYRTTVISIFIFLVMFLAANMAGVAITRRFLAPIRKLSEASQRIMEGDMKVDVTYNGEDEIGILISNFKNMAARLESQLDTYSTMAYTDALTGINNKASYDVFVSVLSEKIKGGYGHFGVLVADLNNLKEVNDRYGHTSGDLLIKSAVSLLSRSFTGSPVFRIGGDELVVIFEDEDYDNRELLVERMKILLDRSNRNLPAGKQVSLAYSMAVFVPGKDESFYDVFEKADRLMYEKKREMKG